MYALWSHTLAMTVRAKFVVLVTVPVRTKLLPLRAMLAPARLLLIVTASPLESLTEPLYVNSSPTVIIRELAADIDGAKLPVERVQFYFLFSCCMAEYLYLLLC